MRQMNKITSINKDTLGILSNLVEKTIADLIRNSLITKELEKLAGKKYVAEHFKNLKLKLFAEINWDDKDITTNNYASLKRILPSSKIISAKINATSASIYKEINRKNINGKYLINIVFPCRNSAKIIQNSIELLVSEIKKAHGIDFNVVFQVNNTSDDTINKIVKSLDHYRKLTRNVNFYIVETDSDLQLSLPGSLNLGFNFIKDAIKDYSDKYTETFFSFWDDELLNLISTPDSLFNSNLNELLYSKTNKAISGYMIDNRINVSRWHEICKGFSSDIRFIYSKPYLHGGAGTLLRLKDYPKKGIKLGGIADTDLSGYLLKNVGYKTLKKLNYNNWPVRSNPNAPVFHPIENNILKWTAKYLMYQISWEITYNSLNKGNPKLGVLWKKIINKNRSDFHQKINDYLINLSPEKVLDREFMHYYYLTIQNITDKNKLYKKLKSYRKRSLEIKQNDISRK